jgi:hypothetical protein
VRIRCSSAKDTHRPLPEETPADECPYQTKAPHLRRHRDLDRRTRAGRLRQEREQHRQAGRQRHRRRAEGPIELRPTCNATQYGAPKIDLASATVGFSQSESTSNPFRATETKSIEDEAKKLNIKLIERNANADVNAQNSQIEDMIAQGAQVLIIAPENSDGLAPALAQAKAKHIPVLTIDRTVTGTACSDFIAFIGSDFTGQAKIAADDLGAATGGTAKVAVLEGTSGNNVAQERTQGFKDEIAAKFPNITIVAENDAWIAFVPFAARWPYEVHLYPKQRHPDLLDLDAGERDLFPGIYLDLLRRFDRLFDTPAPYIAAWHQAPAHDGGRDMAVHLQLFTNRRSSGKLKYLAGSESGMDVFANDISPEQAAARLRSLI